MSKVNEYLKTGIEGALFLTVLFFTIQEWKESTKTQRQVSIALLAILLVQIDRCVIVLRYFFKESKPHFDIPTTVTLSLIFILDLFTSETQSELLDSSKYANFSPFHKFTQIVFLSILALNLFHYCLVVLIFLIYSVINLGKIWIQTEADQSNRGLTNAEFLQLQITVVKQPLPQAPASFRAPQQQQQQQQPLRQSQISPPQQECSICLSAFEDFDKKVEMAVCKHSFHEECIKIWFKKSVNCPYCRNDVRKALQQTQKNLPDTLAYKAHILMDDIIDQVEPSFSIDSFIQDNHLDMSFRIDQQQLLQQILQQQQQQQQIQPLPQQQLPQIQLSQQQQQQQQEQRLQRLEQLRLQHQQLQQQLQNNFQQPPLQSNNQLLQVQLEQRGQSGIQSPLRQSQVINP